MIVMTLILHRNLLFIWIWIEYWLFNFTVHWNRFQLMKVPRLSFVLYHIFTYVRCACMYVNVNEQYAYFTNSRVYLISIYVHMILLCLTFWSHFRYKFCPNRRWSERRERSEWVRRRFYIKNTLLECEQPHRLNVRKARRRGKGFW